MKYWMATVCLSLFLVSCGKEKPKEPAGNANPPPAPAPAPTNKGWTDTQSQELKTLCVSNGIYYYPEYPETQFRTYCDCIVGAVVSRWSYEEFNRNREKHIQELADADKVCTDKAGFYTATATRLIR